MTENLQKNDHNIERHYCSPTIDCIVIDNEISLTLDSAPPIGPLEGMNKTPEAFHNNPFQIT